jgi:hypothetical protein
MVLFCIARIGAPVGANCTRSTTGAGIWPSCRTTTVVALPLVRASWIDPSTPSVVNSQEYQNHERS